MAKKHDDVIPLESPVAEEPAVVRFKIATLANPDEVHSVVSPDGTLEDAVRQFNTGRQKPFTAKQLIIEPA